MVNLQNVGNYVLQMGCSELSLQQFTCTNGLIKTKRPVEESGETKNFYGKIVWAHILEHEGESAIYLKWSIKKPIKGQNKWK